MKRMWVLVAVMMGLLVVGFSSLSAPNQAWIPGLASLALPGLGQLLNDELDKAILHFGVDIGIWVFGIYGWAVNPYISLIVPTLHLAWAVYSAYDAYTVAKTEGFSIGFVPHGVGFSYSF